MRIHGQKGNALFIILLGIALLAALSWFMTSTNKGGINQTGTAQMDSQIQILFSQGSLLAGAIQQMIVNGADPNAIYGTVAATGLNTVTPGGTPPAGFANWDTAPHMLKIYHPYGGGVKYMSQSGTGAALSDANNLANNFLIRKASIVKGVGATNTAGDILFTAHVSSSAACKRIDTLLTGSATVPAVTDATTFGNLFTNTDGTTNGTLDDNTGGGANTCASCINHASYCVSNAGNTDWGYYQALLPQ